MTLYEFKNTKAGMTLVEMVVSLAILSVLMTSTLGMIVSSNSIFISTSKAAIDKSVGNDVFDLLENILKYTTHLEISDQRDTGLKQCISVSEKDTTNKCGYIYYKGEDDTSLAPLYDDAFYGNNRYVQYSVKEVGSDGKHVQLTVNVFRNGERVYTREQIIRCVNLALISGDNGNAIEESDDAPEYNQVISFSVDEMLFSGGSSAWNIEYKMASYIAKYNTILKEYYGYLNTAIAEVNGLYDTYSDSNANVHLSYSVYATAKEKRDKAIWGVTNLDTATTIKNINAKGELPDNVNFNGGDNSDPSNLWSNMRAYYQKQIYDLLTYSPQTITDSKDPYYMVIASREELYTGFLLTYYDKDHDGDVEYDEFPSFDDAEEFFAGTTMLDYATADDNKMVILGYSRDDSNDFKKNGSYYDPYYSVDYKTDLVVAVGEREENVSGYSARVASGNVWSYTTDAAKKTTGWVGEDETGLIYADYYMEEKLDASDIATKDSSGNAINYASQLCFSITAGDSYWNAKVDQQLVSDGSYSIYEPTEEGKTVHNWKSNVPYYKRNGDPLVTTASIQFNNYSYDTVNNVVTFSYKTETDSMKIYHKTAGGWATQSDWIGNSSSNPFYHLWDSVALSAGITKYFSYETYVPTDFKTLTYGTSSIASYYSAAQYVIQQLNATPVGTDSIPFSTKKTVYVSSTDYTDAGDAKTVTRYVFKPTGIVTEGWYYYTIDTVSGTYDTAVKNVSGKDNNPKTYVFFYIDALSYSEGDVTVNSSRVAMNPESKRTDGTNECEIQLFTYSSGEIYGYSYDRAAYVLSEDGESCVLVKLDGTSSSKADSINKSTVDTSPVRYYTVKCHQYTDYILYGVDWQSWFGSSSKGLLNRAIGWVASLFTNTSDITQISASNSTKSLGKVGQYTANSISSSEHSYDAAYVVYNSQTGTWYYLPASSSMVSTSLTGLQWSSVKNEPTLLDVDTDWASSTALQQDIKNMKYSSPGIFGISNVGGIDTSRTKDVNWQSLPVNTEGLS